MILDMAKSWNVPREELPKQILVISDMEFDMATKLGAWSNENWRRADDKLFEVIAKQYEQNVIKEYVA